MRHIVHYIVGLRRFWLHASALVDDKDAPPPDVGHQRGTLESYSHPTRLLRLADGARPEGFSRSGDTGSANGSYPTLILDSLWLILIVSKLILRDEKRIALAVTEAVENGNAQTLILSNALDERLRLAPVLSQVPAFGDD